MKDLTSPEAVKELEHRLLYPEAPRSAKEAVEEEIATIMAEELPEGYPRPRVRVIDEVEGYSVFTPLKDSPNV